MLFAPRTAQQAETARQLDEATISLQNANLELQGQTRALTGSTRELQGNALELQGQLKAQNAQILANGPRADAIDKAAPELIKQLGLFPGQRVSIYMAAYMTAPAPERPTDVEAASTLWSIRRLLEDGDGAKWKIVAPEVKYSPLASGQRIGLLRSSEAPEQTAKAAKTLADGITRALPQSPVRISLQYPVVYRRQHGSFTPKGFQLPNGDDPEAKVFIDPESIVVLIGRHPIP
jgi:hypothetical protein